MLRKSHRQDTKRFIEVMEKGRIVTSPLFVMRVLHKQSEQGLTLTSGKSIHAKVSAVAPKKIANTAVLRNKIRRQIYEAVRPFVKNILPNTSLIIFAKKEMIDADFKTILEDIKQLFVKARISV